MFAPRIFLSFVIVCIPFSLAVSQTITEKAARGEVEWVAKESPAMKKAFQKARDSLPEFLELTRSPPAGISGASLKVAISDAGTTEYFWVTNFKESDGMFRGTLNNEPRIVRKYRLGEVFTFSRDQIADWMYYTEGGKRMVGNYTGCAILSTQPPEQSAEFKRQYGLRCE